MSVETRDAAPTGRYLAGEVGMLAGVSGDRIGQWARHGYIDASRSRGDPYVYSYQDVAEALVVHELEDAGADLASIRRAIEHLRRRHGSGWAVRRLPDLRHIEVNPDRLAGRPVIRGTRVPVSMVAELAARPQGMRILREDFALSGEQTDDARRWWDAAVQFEAA